MHENIEMNRKSFFRTCLRVRHITNFVSLCCVAVCCSVLQCVAMCFNVLQCVES